MLADLAPWLISVATEHYVKALLLMLSGACLVLAGYLAVFIVRRRDVMLGEPDVPTYNPPAPTRILLPPHSHAAREDTEDTEVIKPPWAPLHMYREDTHVIPCIPGATPPAVAEVLGEFLDDVEDVTAALRVIDHDEPVTDALLERVRHGLKSGSEKGSEATQVIGLCPLTTLEFEIVESAPLFRETFIRYPHTELTTQNLTAVLDRAKERVS